MIELFTQKFVNKLSKIWIWDPGSEIWKKPIPDPGSRGQKGTGARIRIRNTGYCKYEFACEGKIRGNGERPWDLNILSLVNHDLDAAYSA